ncbi:MAG: hypothetical protein Kapaf2KO_22750 [Candidatus Kapaibacteriales bacterium]
MDYGVITKEEIRKELLKELRPGYMIHGKIMAPIGPILGNTHKPPTKIFLPEYTEEGFDEDFTDDLESIFGGIDDYDYKGTFKQHRPKNNNQYQLWELFNLLEKYKIGKHYSRILLDRFFSTYDPPYTGSIRWNITDILKPELLYAYSINTPEVCDYETDELDFFYLKKPDGELATYGKVKDFYITHPFEPSDECICYGDHVES